VDSARAAMSRIAQAGPGVKLKLEGIRDGKRVVITATTGRRPEER